MATKKGESSNISTELTVIAAFLMGFIDAYTFLQHDQTFASAQTGNLVSLSVKLFTGQWLEASSHAWVFGGFVLGAFAGEAVLERYQGISTKNYRYFLLLQTILLLILALFQQDISGAYILFTLGTLAGYELTIFRSFRKTTVNNGIMTGNVKNLMKHLYLMVFRKDSEARSHFTDLMATVLIFFFGAGAGAVVIQYNPHYILWAAFTISFLTLAWSSARPNSSL